MTCFRCGYCCDNVDIAGQNQYKKYDSSNIPLGVIQELADIEMTLKGKCPNNKIVADEAVFDHFGLEVKLIGDIYGCSVYKNRHQICKNEIIRVSKETLADRLENNLPVPRCKVAENFGVEALVRCYDIESVIVDFQLIV